MATARYGNPEAVVFDFSPVNAYLAQQIQARQAQQQQLDKQINEDLTKLSLEGARTQDYDRIRSGYDAFKNAAINYKKAFRDPAARNAAEQEYLNAKVNLNSLVSQSKEAKERTKGIYDFYAKNRDEINEDEFRKSVELINAPIGTQLYEQGKNYDITNIIFKPEQFDSSKWQPVINSVKPHEVTAAEELPNGMIKTTKRRLIDPGLFSQTVEGLYESDLGHGKKYWDTQFKNLLPQDKEIYEEYMNKYIPGFTIQAPKDLAVGSLAYGRLEQDMGNELKGVNRTRIENFQREIQRKIDVRLDKRIAALMQKDAEKNYYVIDDIATALSRGNGASAVAPIKAEATQGVVVRYISDADLNNPGMVDRIHNDLKKDGIDSDTRLLSRKQVGNGIIVVGVPKVNPETKEAIKGQYEYMAVPRDDEFAQPRINAILNYAKGADGKLLPQKYYKNKMQGTSRNEQIISNQAYGPAQLDDIEEDENE